MEEDSQGTWEAWIPEICLLISQDNLIARENTGNVMLSEEKAEFTKIGPQSTWRSHALRTGPFVVAKRRGQDNSWRLIAGPSVLLEVSGAPNWSWESLKQSRTAQPSQEGWASAMRADLAQTDEKQKQVKRIEEEPTF
ncbi:hypothetical protein CB1_002455002 [Camelus ferus]|nr:hypothetical protein CB1_002455002 [Camelus ferus]